MGIMNAENKSLRVPRVVLITILGLFAALLFWWASVERTSGAGPRTSDVEHDVQRAALPILEPESAPGTGTREVIDAAPVAQADAAYLDRAGHLRAELRELIPLAQAWPPNMSYREFFNVDMQPLRDRVIELGVTEDDLAGLLDGSSYLDPLQTVLLASFAFVPQMGEFARDLVLRMVREAYPTYIIQDGHSPPLSQIGACYAAVFALQMRDAGDHTQAMALDLLQLHSAAQRQNEWLRDLAAVTLMDVGISESIELQDALRRGLAAAPEPVLTSTLYEGLCQIGNPADLESVVNLARSRAPAAKHGLEAMRDPSMVPALENLSAAVADPTINPVYAQYLAASAARGLLSIGTAGAMSAFERLSLSKEPHLWAAAWSSLDLQPSPVTAGALAKIAVQARTAGHPTAEVLGIALEGAKQRLMRCTVSVEDRRRCAAGVRDALPDLLVDHQTLRAALEVLAASGEAQDRPDFAHFAGGLPESVQTALGALWDKAHPTAVLVDDSETRDTQDP
jgi:hypothetical protein